MNSPIISMIHPVNIAPLWSQIEPLIEPAVQISETHNCEDIYHSLMGGKSQLWTQWNEKVEAAVVTEFKHYPRGLWFNLWLAGALKGAHIIWKEFYNILYEYARSCSCAGIEDCGRGGWDHHAPDAKKIGFIRRIRIGASNG